MGEGESGASGGKSAKLDKRSTDDNSPDEPLTQEQAKGQIRRILEEGTFSFTRHCREELEKDDRSTVDCVNALRGGAVQPPEWENGAWRYRVDTGRVTVILEFDPPDGLIVVTAWRTAR